MPMILPLAAEIFEGVLAGDPAAALVHRLPDVPEEERKLLLCTLCAMRNEIRTNCSGRVEQVETFLTRACPFFHNGVPTCQV